MIVVYNAVQGLVLSADGPAALLLRQRFDAATIKALRTRKGSPSPIGSAGDELPAEADRPGKKGSKS